MQHFFSSIGNLDDVINSKSDVSPLDTKALHGMAFREDLSFVDDNSLYAVRLRTKKLRSFKVPCFLPLSVRHVFSDKPETLLHANMNASLDYRSF